MLLALMITLLGFATSSQAQKATNPYPPDGATDVPEETVLSWNPGAYAASHNVYLGTDTLEFLGNQTETSCNVQLDPGTMYYWRIDEVDIEGITHVGDPWQFTTEEYLVNLSVYSLEAIPNQIIAGDPFEAYYSVQNSESGYAGASTGIFFLSHDEYWDWYDPDVEWVLLPAVPGNSITGTQIVILYTPPNDPYYDDFYDGRTTFYLGLYVDALWEIDETDEDNNLSFTSITIDDGSGGDDDDDVVPVDQVTYPPAEKRWYQCPDGTIIVAMHISIARGTLYTDVPICRVESAQGSTIDFRLYYDSGKADGSLAKFKTVLGYGWTHNYNIFLIDDVRGVSLSDAQGRMTRFYKNGGNYVASPGETHELSQVDSDTFLLKELDGSTKTFKRFTRPSWLISGEFYQLTQIARANGQTTTLIYDNQGRLITITDPFGRQVTLEYQGSSNMLSTIRNVDNTTTQIHYTADDLTRITDPLGNTLEYTYDSKHRMLTEKMKDGNTWTCEYNNAGKPYRLVDENGDVFAVITNSDNWETDQDRLQQSHEVSYLSGQVAVTDGRGVNTHYSYDQNGYITKIMHPDDSVREHQYNDNLRLIALIDEAGHTWHYERDQYGNPTRIEDPLGNVTRMFYEHDIKSLMTKKIEPDDDVWLYEYDSRGNLIRQIDPVVEWPIDRVMSYTYNDQGLRTSTTDRNGHVVHQQYNPNGTLAANVIDPWELSIYTEYQYDQAGRLTEHTLYRGSDLADPVTTQYQYDALGQLITQVVDPGGLNLTTSFSYDGEGRVIRQTNPRGVITENHYDVRGRLSRQVIDPGGLELETKNWYDGKGNLIKVEDPEGNQTQYEYDNLNRLVKIIDAEGYWTLYEYDQRGNNTYIKHSINRGGSPYQIMKYKYDQLSRRTHEIVDPDGLALTTEFEYAQPGGAGCACGTPGSSLVHKTIDPMGKVTYRYYDILDRLTHLVRKVSDTDDNEGDADDAITRYEYDFMGNQTKVVVENAPCPDMVTTYSYDAADRLIEQVLAPGGSNLMTTYVYDCAGNMLRKNTPLGNVINSVYDKANRLIEQSDAIGKIAGYTYDENSNVLTQTDGLGRTLKYAYDNVDRRIEIYDPLVEAPSDKHMTFAYDKNGSLIQQIDNEGLVTTYTYDGLGRRLTETHDPGGLDITITRAYGILGNLTDRTDDNGNTTSYEYDQTGRKIREVYADGTDVTFAYDKVGNVITRTDQMDNTTTYRYNDLYRLTTKAYADGHTDTFTYDRLGRLLSADNNHSHIGYTYDDMGRVLSSTQVDVPQSYSHTVQYAYSTTPNERIITYPSGKIVKELRDVRGRLVEIIVDGVKTAWYDYENPGNQVLARSFANGTKTEYAYNDNGWVVGLRHIGPDGRTFAGFAHDYDAVGNRLNAVNLQNVLPYDDAKPVTQSEMYSYDAIYRLVDFKRGMSLGGDIPWPNRDRTWQLDGVGNWAQFSIDEKTYTNSINQMNEYDDWSINGPAPVPDDDGLPDDFKVDTDSGFNHAHDKNGNLVDDGTKEYYYDYDHRSITQAKHRVNNQLTMIRDNQTGSILGEYWYDAIGRRIRKLVNGTSTVYIYTSDWRVIEEYEGNMLSLSYTYGRWIDEVLTMDHTIDDDRLYYHANALGSIITLTDSSGLPVEAYGYDAYGQTFFFDSSGIPMADSAIGNPYLYTGRRYDPETGFYYYRNRYHKPQAGRFISRDPLGSSLNLGNLYSYVKNRPIGFIDPLGLQEVGAGDGINCPPEDVPPNCESDKGANIHKDCAERKVGTEHGPTRERGPKKPPDPPQPTPPSQPPTQPPTSPPTCPPCPTTPPAPGMRGCWVYFPPPTCWAWKACPPPKSFLKSLTLFTVAFNVSGTGGILGGGSRGTGFVGITTVGQDFDSYAIGVYLGASADVSIAGTVSTADDWCEFLAGYTLSLGGSAGEGIVGGVDVGITFNPFASPGGNLLDLSLSGSIGLGLGLPAEIHVFGSWTVPIAGNCFLE